MLRVAEEFAKSDTGRQRPANEDAHLARAPVFVVADGMGGAQAGEVASHMAVEAFEPGLPDDASSPEQGLAEIVRDANRRIHERAQTDESYRGMGTTVSVAYVGEDEIAIAHVGDSRIYAWRDGKLARLTLDHSLAGEWVRQGRMTEEDAEEHPHRSIITRAVGPEPEVEVDTLTYPARDGDVLLICSDGLTSMIPEARIADVLREAPDLPEAGRRLIREANAAGGRDNITVVLFRLEDVGAPGPGAVEQPTQAGASAPRTAEMRAVVAAPPPALPAPAAPPPAPAPSPAPPSPRPEGSAPRPPRRRRRALAGATIVVAVLALVAAGGWFATRAVYFVGTNGEGLITVYRGLPYDLPAGVHLYEPEYISGMPASEVPPTRRRRLLDHKLRSQSDAADLVRRLEEGQIAG
jgi:serine/threonine protein phosphatase PrpC